MNYLKGINKTAVIALLVGILSVSSVCAAVVTETGISTRPSSLFKNTDGNFIMEFILEDSNTPYVSVTDPDDDTKVIDSASVSLGTNISVAELFLHSSALWKDKTFTIGLSWDYLGSANGNRIDYDIAFLTANGTRTSSYTTSGDVKTMSPACTYLRGENDKTICGLGWIQTTMDQEDYQMALADDYSDTVTIVLASN